MEVGDRVRIKSSDYTLGINSRVGCIGTLKVFKGGEVWTIETDEFTDGHDDNGAGKGGYCWFVNEKDLEKLSMTREDIQAQLYKKLHSVKGVGAATASRCTEAAMEYLDTLVEESGVSGGEGAPTDFPWDAIPDKYKWAAWDYYIYEDNTKQLFAYTERPTLVPDTHNIVWSEGKGSASHIAHICDIPDCSAFDGPTTLHPSQFPDNLIPSTPEEAREWLFQRPE